MKVYVLMESDFDGGSRIQAVITRRDVADEWATGRFEWYDEFELDDYSEIQWVVNKVDGKEHVR